MWRRRLVRSLLLAASLIPATPGAVDAPRRVGPLHAYPVVEVPADSPRPRAGGVEEHVARRAVSADTFHDPSNPDLVHLQRYEDAVAALPKDANGFPDWMRALAEGRISPRGNLGNGGDAMDVLDLDIIMKNTREMPWVRFPHRSHTLWLTCSNCHPQPFEARAGATEIRMSEIFRGRHCGMCHDRVAFVTFFSCARCHSVAQGAAGSKRNGGMTRQ